MLLFTIFRDVNSVDQDSLRLDVWDFNPEESVNEKLNKINQVKDGRGLRKFIKATIFLETPCAFSNISKKVKRYVLN